MVLLVQKRPERAKNDIRIPLELTATTNRPAAK
jgi:hypothetical protein